MDRGNMALTKKQRELIQTAETELGQKGLTLDDLIRLGRYWRLWKARVDPQEQAELVFESGDPQEFVDKAQEFEDAAKDRGPIPGYAGGTFSIQGDPVALGVVNVKDVKGNVIRGREKLRTPRGRD